MRIVGIIIITLLIVIGTIGYGVRLIIQQHMTLANAQQTSGKVIKPRLVSGLFGTTKPNILFEYRVAITQYQGNKYQSRRLAPIPVICSEPWAKSIIREYKRGKDVKVYFQPTRLEEGFLLPLRQFYPYIFVLLGIAVLLIAQWPLRLGGFFEKPSEPISTGQFGWYRLTPNMITARRSIALAWTTLIWYISGIAIYLHFFVGLGPPFEGITPWVVMVLFFAIGLLPGIMWIKSIKANTSFGEPALTTTEPQLNLSKPVIVRFEQPITAKVDLREMRVALTCYERTGFSSHKLFSTSAMTAEHKTLQPNHTVTGEFTFEVPEKKQKPGSIYNRWEYPRIDWCFDVTAKLIKGGNYRASFPIETELPPPGKKKKNEK